MKSRTSFFNATVLRKDITRFAPVWGLYSVFTLLFLLLLWDSHSSAPRLANSAPEIFLAMGMVNFLYAPLVGFLLFGDLFKSRMCNALHALPMRREGWFLTHFTAGMLFCLVPNSVAALLVGAMLREYAWMALLWLALMIMQYLFFLGVAIFSTQCAGNTLGAIAVYAIVNFLAVLAGWLATTFYEPLLYGIRLDFEAFARCSPIIRFCEANYLETHFDNMTDSLVFEGFVGADWRYVGIAAGVGLVLLGLSVLLYRKRQMESAGDLISFRPAVPVFSVIYTLCVGAVLFVVADAITGTLGYVFLLVGLGIGFFTGRMLLERKVKVFRGRNFLGFGILVAVFLATLGITALDPVGVTRYVPEADKVDSVEVCFSHYYYDVRNDTITLTEPEAIKTVTGIHQSCIDKPCEGRYEQVPLYVRYKMKNGTTTERYYYLPKTDPGLGKLSFYFSAVDAVFGESPAYILRNLRLMEAYSQREDRPLTAIAYNSDYLDIDYYTEKYVEKDNHYFYLTTTPEEDPILRGLFEAIEADCVAGSMAQNWQLQDTDIYAHILIRYLDLEVKYLEIDVYYGCENTVAFLESLSVNPLDGTTD